MPEKIAPDSTMFFNGAGKQQLTAVLQGVKDRTLTIGQAANVIMRWKNGEDFSDLISMD